MGKASAQEREYHQLILSGDTLALSKLYELYGESLVKIIKSRYPKCAKEDDAEILQAVNEGLFGYFKNPRTFNPELNTLKRFLEIACERDLLNIIDANKKFKIGREKISEDVEIAENFWNRVKKDDTGADNEIISKESEETRDLILSQHFDLETDIELARLILCQERKSEIFVEILNIAHLPPEEQQREVKKNKDRIKKVLERNEVEERLKTFLE